MFAHGLARDPRDVDVLARRQLAGDDDQPGRDQRLAGDAALRVVRERCVEDGVRDLVGDLVRVTLGHRLGREQEAPRGHWRVRVPKRYDVLTYTTNDWTSPSREPNSSSDRSGRRLFSTCGRQVLVRELGEPGQRRQRVLDVEEEEALGAVGHPGAVLRLLEHRIAAQVPDAPLQLGERVAAVGDDELPVVHAVVERDRAEIELRRACRRRPASAPPWRRSRTA